MSWIASRSARLRGAILHWASRRYERVVLPARPSSTLPFLLLELLSPPAPRRVVLLEYQPLPRVGSWTRRIDESVRHVVLRLSLARTVRTAHVCAAFEVEEYARRYRVPRSRFRCVPWPLGRATDPRPEGVGRRPPRVLSSGRWLCDWETLFRAAQGQGWDLTVVSSRRDRPEVERLAALAPATVLCEIPRAEHDALLARARVYVASLREERVSAGHVRVMAAVGAGTPVVATAVRGLRGNLVDGRDALLVAPGDPLAMRAAVNRLLAQPEEAERLALAAHEDARGRTFEAYKERIRALVRDP